MTPLPFPSCTPGRSPVPAVSPCNSVLPLSSTVCKTCLTAPRLPNMTCTPPPRYCGRLFVVPPGQIYPSACQTPTGSTLGLWTQPSRHLHRRIPTSLSGVSVPRQLSVIFRLIPRFSSVPSAPCFCRHHCCTPQPVPPSGVLSGGPPHPPPH